MILDIIASVLGAGLAISYVGFLAWKVAATPLMIIVGFCTLLMLYALYDDVAAKHRAYRRTRI
ncbi:hypothetical protein [Bradyrhizobium sp. USDA 10063]